MAHKSNLRVVPSPETTEPDTQRVSVPAPLKGFLGVLIGRIDKIEGIFGLAKEAVYAEAETNQTLTRCWCAMEFALTELNSIRDDIDNAGSGKLPWTY
jgi:hypothetical protein